jgi:hypothetical protein
MTIDYSRLPFPSLRGRFIFQHPILVRVFVKELEMKETLRDISPTPELIVGPVLLT